MISYHSFDLLYCMAMHIYLCKIGKHFLFPIKKLHFYVDFIKTEVIYSHSIIDITLYLLKPIRFENTFVVSSNETKDVFMSQHNCLINFCLTKPRSFISGGEYFHSHIFPTPSSMPDLTKSTFSYYLLKYNRPGNCSLNQQRQA